MPTDTRVADIVNLAAMLRDEYAPGTALRNLIELEGYDSERAGDEVEATFFVELAAQGNDLRSLIASFDAIQFAVDAAAATVFYDSLPGTRDGDSDESVLEVLARSPFVSLEIVALADGSFGGRVKAVFLNPVPRRIVIAVAVIATVAINIILPPVIVPLLVVTGIGAVSEIAVAIQDHRAQQERKRLDEAAAERETALRAQLAQQDERIRALENRPVVDVQAITEARITKVEVRVDGRAEAA
jgi:hypothetical protein